MLKPIAFLALTWFGILQYNQLTSPTDGYLGNIRNFTDKKIAEHNIESVNKLLADNPQFSSVIPFPDAIIKTGVNLAKTKGDLETLCKAIDGNAQSINKLVSGGEVTTDMPNVSASEAKGLMADALMLAQKTMAASMPSEMAKIQALCKGAFDSLNKDSQDLADKDAKAADSGFIPLQALAGKEIPLHTQKINGNDVLQLKTELVDSVVKEPKATLSRAIIHMPPLNMKEEWKMIPFKPERWAVVTLLLFVLSSIGSLFSKPPKKSPTPRITFGKK